MLAGAAIAVAIELTGSHSDPLSRAVEVAVWIVGIGAVGLGYHHYRRERHEERRRSGNDGGRAWALAAFLFATIIGVIVGLSINHKIHPAMSNRVVALVAITALLAGSAYHYWDVLHRDDRG